MSTTIPRPFWKMHGLGNDYVVVRRSALDDQSADLDLGQLARRLCDRRLGIGADGLLLVDASSDPRADLRMRILNQDGSEAEMCGNGLRCAVRFAIRERLVSPGDLRVSTGAGILSCHGSEGELVTADLGTARSAIAARTLGPERRLLCVDMGNPHAVLFLGQDEFRGLDLPAVAAELVTPEAFPAGVNLECVEVRSRTHVLQRTWERGVGETAACGTGAAAVALAAWHEGLVDRKLVVELTGGDLELELREYADGIHAVQTGPAVFVFEGTLQ